MKYHLGPKLIDSFLNTRFKCYFFHLISSFLIRFCIRGNFDLQKCLNSGKENFQTLYNMHITIIHLIVRPSYDTQSYNWDINTFTIFSHWFNFRFSVWFIWGAEYLYSTSLLRFLFSSTIIKTFIMMESADKLIIYTYKKKTNTEVNIATWLKTVKFRGKLWFLNISHITIMARFVKITRGQFKFSEYYTSETVKLKFQWNVFL